MNAVYCREAAVFFFSEHAEKAAISAIVAKATMVRVKSRYFIIQINALSYQFILSSPHKTAEYRHCACKKKILTGRL